MLMIRWLHKFILVMFVFWIYVYSLTLFFFFWKKCIKVYIILWSIECILTTTLRTLVRKIFLKIFYVKRKKKNNFFLFIIFYISHESSIKLSFCFLDTCQNFHYQAKSKISYSKHVAMHCQRRKILWDVVL